MPILPTTKSADLIHCYLQEIKRIPLLTKEQELLYSFQVRQVMSLLETKKALTQNLHHEPTLEEWATRVRMLEPELQTAVQRGEIAKQELIQANLRMVVKIAKRYQYRELELLDLIQEGNLGLMQAVEKFDPSKGYRFFTYAQWWVMQGMKHALANQSCIIRLPTHVIEKLNKIKKIQCQLVQKLGRTPTLAEVAAGLKLSLEQVKECLTWIKQQPISLNVRVRESQETELLELVEDTKEMAEDFVNQSFLTEDLQKLTENLTSQQQKVLYLRYGLENGKDLTPMQIATKLGISRARVCQLEFQVIKKIRQNKCTQEKLQSYLSA